MTLDFPTLYIILALNFICVSFVWAVIAYNQRNFKPARVWFISCFLISIGAANLALQGNLDVQILSLVGNCFILSGLFLSWIAIRTYYNLEPKWSATGLFVLILVLLSFAVYEHVQLRQVVYSLGYSLPLLLSIFVLTKQKKISSSAAIAFVALCIGFLACIWSAALHIGFFNSFIDFRSYRQIQSLTLLAFLSSGLLWLMGFTLMSMDSINHELADMALSDELTGVSNRRRFNLRLLEVLAESKRSGESFALAFVDIDHFKDLNDTYGHGAGDASLIHLTDILNRKLRQNDLLGRQGGDEFSVILPNTNAVQGQRIAERLVEAIQNATFEWRGQKINISVSIGVAIWTPQLGSNPEAMYTLADQALYIAKKNGRNRAHLSVSTDHDTVTDSRRAIAAKI